MWKVQKSPVGFTTKSFRKSAFHVTTTDGGKWVNASVTECSVVGKGVGDEAGQIINL